MKQRTLILLACLILIPTVMLAWYGVRLQYNQHSLLQMQLTSLSASKLVDIDQRLVGHFSRVQQALDAEAPSLTRANRMYDQQALDALVDRSPQIEQIFVLDTDNTRLYPSTNKVLSQRAQRFLENADALLQNNALFHTQDSQEAELSAPPPQLSVSDNYLRSAPIVAQESSQALSLKSAPSPRTETHESGWIAWYSDTRLHHIYWRRDSQDRVIGFALNAARLNADLIALLPDSPSDLTLAEGDNSETRLISNTGDVIYSWGRPQATDAKALQVHPLSHPLGSWRLEYIAPAPNSTPINWLSTALVLGLTLTGLSVLGWLIMREYNRDMRLAQARVNFVNQVSHELKTPLTNVRMYAEMLEQQVDSDQTRAQRYLQVINSESQRLSRLIDNVLSFSRLGRGTHTLHPINGRLCGCIQRLVETFEPVLVQRGLTIRFNASVEQEVCFDADAVEQILNNLLSNCEKYAANSGDITITCWHENDMSYIRVQDAGPGIPSTERARIFQPFYRISNQLTDGVSGTGIGLGLARDLARSHGGDLTLESTADGNESGAQGACFLISLKTA